MLDFNPNITNCYGLHVSLGLYKLLKIRLLELAINVVYLQFNQLGGVVEDSTW